MKRIFWLAGENSGDLHAAEVISELNKTDFPAEHFGIGGNNMQLQGLKPLFPFHRFTVMGFVEVLKHLPFFLKIEKKITEILSQTPPDLIVLVDYPGLNMRIARIAKKFKIPVLYYICPQFWAWKHRRIFKLKKYTDMVACILPFEQQYLADCNIPSRYVGHPVAEEIDIRIEKTDFADRFGLDLQKTWLGFLPGSRFGEVKKILPEFVKAIRLFNADQHEFLLSLADTIPGDQLIKFIPPILRSSVTIVPQEMIYPMMKYCRILAVTSGTATLQTAYLGTPFLIVYKAGRISFTIGKMLVKIKRIGLPNIILDDDVIPELLQNQASGKIIYQKISHLLADHDAYNNIKKKLKKLHDLLEIRTPSRQVADIIKNMLND